MSQKFSFVVEVKNGKPIGHAFKKEDAQSAKELFNKLREEGKEAYLFQHPNHDKRCKSAEQMEASKGTEGGEHPATVESVKAQQVEAQVEKIADRNHISIMFRLMLSTRDPTTQQMLRFIGRHSELELQEQPVAGD